MPEETQTANTDVLEVGGGTASASSQIGQMLLQSNFNVDGLRTCDVLRHEDWMTFDNVVINVARQRLRGISDLINRNLTFPVENAMSVMSLHWEQMDDMSPANVSMSGVTEGENDRVAFRPQQVPLPIVHKDFNINMRVLAASRRSNTPLDTTQAGLAARLVSEQLEGILFDGFNVGEAGAPIYGYTNAPFRNTGTSVNWADTDNVSGEDIVEQVLDMMQDSKDENHYGPWSIYVPSDYGNRLNDDYKAASDKTIRQRLLEIVGIESIEESDNLDGEVLLIQMTSDVVDLIDGIQPTTIQWPESGGMITRFKVLAIMVPRVKWTYSDQSGITHYSV